MSAPQSLPYPHGHKPGIPYALGKVIAAHTHTAAPPPDRRTFWPTKQLYKEMKELHPVNICLNHEPTSGTIGSSKLRILVTFVIKSRDCEMTQLVKVRILNADEGTPLASFAGSSHEFVAKFYDPLYYDFSLNMDYFQTAEGHYAREVRAYTNLTSVQGSIVPHFYGSYTTSIDVPECSTKRTVRFILTECVPGNSLNMLDARSYDVKTRQQIMSAVIDSERELRRHDIGHGDNHPRNVMLLGFTESDNGQLQPQLRLIDFNHSSHGYLSEKKLIADLVNGHRPLEKLHCTIGRWKWTHYSPLHEEDFVRWIEGWNWNDWLANDYKPRAVT
ncbi:MAG: hypothetical protein Q9162_000378 [Coniocarpon cinnabarinum]